MTLNELKSLFEEYNQLKMKRTEIFKNDDLSKNQMNIENGKITPRIEELESIFRKYYLAFSVNANILARKICYILSHNISESEVSFQHACNGEYYNQEFFEGHETRYSGKASLKISINSLGKTETISLFEHTVVKNLKYNIDYVMGNYNLNTYNLLCNNNIKFSQLFHKACWLAIEDSIKSKNKDLQTTVTEKQKLINKKIAELRKQSKLLEKQNKEIEKDSTIILTSKEVEAIEEIKEI